MSLYEQQVMSEAPIEHIDSLDASIEFTIGAHVLRDPQVLQAVADGREGIMPPQDVINAIGASCAVLWLDNPDVFGHGVSKKRVFEFFCAAAGAAVDHGFHITAEEPGILQGQSIEFELRDTAHLL